MTDRMRYDLDMNDEHDNRLLSQPTVRKAHWRQPPTDEEYEKMLLEGK